VAAGDQTVTCSVSRAVSWGTCVAARGLGDRTRRRPSRAPRTFGVGRECRPRLDVAGGVNASLERRDLLDVPLREAFLAGSTPARPRRDPPGSPRRVVPRALTVSARTPVRSSSRASMHDRCRRWSRSRRTASRIATTTSQPRMLGRRSGSYARPVSPGSAPRAASARPARRAGRARRRSRSRARRRAPSRRPRAALRRTRKASVLRREPGPRRCRQRAGR
jgi:hypothetical protein